MASLETIQVLNRLLKIHCRSLPMYLGYAAPWTSFKGDERARDVLAAIVTGQRATVEQLTEMIVDEGAAPDRGVFPMHFTGLHDLALDYLLVQLIEHQRRDVAAIQECVDQLAMVPAARAFAEETLGQAKGHLDLLEELTQQPAGA